MKITFGETDGEAEANALRFAIGYTIRLDGHDYTLLGVDKGGVTTRDNDVDTGIFATDAFWPWLMIDEIHVY